jgi:hypothetical protein
MGMEQVVTYPSDTRASWPAARDLLASDGFPVQLRMIDGELAFPDEMPPEDWHELRLGTPAGMVTVRREVDRLVLAVWGNADDGMVRAWNALTWAFADTGNGIIHTEHGLQTAVEYKQSAELPARPGSSC